MEHQTPHEWEETDLKGRISDVLRLCLFDTFPKIRDFQCKRCGQTLQTDYYDLSLIEGITDCDTKILQSVLNT